LTRRSDALYPSPLPRKLRVEYPGAIYHVMSRGDRQDFFKTVAEACQKTGWQVHACCLMSNHNHRVLEIPNANLVAGMAWLQSTYTIRLNHRHKLVGHVLSGRYKAQLVEGDLEAIKLAIQAEVAVDYFTLRALDSERAVLRSSVQVFSKSFDLTMDRRAGGVATDLDVAEAETVLKTTQAQLPAVALQRAQFEHALALLVGQPAGAFRVPERTLSDAPPWIPSELPSELLERRPDISAAERRMAAANANIGVAKAAFFPTVQLNGLAGLESVDAGTPFNWSGRMWAVGPSLTLAL
jgi:hypothetical protein